MTARSIVRITLEIKMPYELIDDYSDDVRFKILGLGVSGCKAIDYLIEHSNFSEFKGISYTTIHSHFELLLQTNANHTFLIEPERLATADIQGKDELFEHYLCELMGDEFDSSDAIFILTDFREVENIKLVSAINKLLSKNRTLGSAFIVAIINQPAVEEGEKLQALFNQGEKELLKYCDTTIVTSAAMLLCNLAGENKPHSSYFNQELKANYQSLKVIIYPVVYPGLISVDYADIKTVASGQQKGLVVSGQNKGENRANQAVNQAINNAEQEWDFYSTEISGAIAVMCSADINLTEFDAVSDFIRQKTNNSIELKIAFAVGDEKNGQLEVIILLVKKSEL